MCAIFRASFAARAEPVQLQWQNLWVKQRRTHIIGTKHGQTMEVPGGLWMNIDLHNFERLIGIEILAPTSEMVARLNELSLIAGSLRRRRPPPRLPRPHKCGAWSPCCGHVVWRPTGCSCRSSGSNSRKNGVQYTVGGSAALASAMYGAIEFARGPDPRCARLSPKRRHSRDGSSRRLPPSGGAQNVLGAICGYLIAGSAWVAHMNAIAYLLVPSAYSVNPDVAGFLTDWHGRAALFTYYAFVQVMTMGYS
jgi:hypothetical protein